LPEFLDIYIKDLCLKANYLKSLYNLHGDRGLSEALGNYFGRYWVEFNFPKDSSVDFNVLAVDSSSRHLSTENGGLFYVARALGLTGSGDTYRRVDCGFDFCFTGDGSDFVGRVMEWLEHLTIMDALNSGFRGVILLDGSIYGRLSHVPLEFNLTSNKDFMIRYFDDLIKLMDLCRRFKVPLIGVSKGSASHFFRDFLLGLLAVDVGVKLGFDALSIKNYIFKVFDDRKNAANLLSGLPEDLKRVFMELIHRKPDFQLILRYAKSTGYTYPLLLNPPPRTIRAFKRAELSPIEFLKSAFPYSSISEDFVNWASGVVSKLHDLPAIISFHVLPSIGDTPMRVDVPAWVFDVDEKFIDFRWPEAVDVDVSPILKILSAGYCGLDNYNVWLTSVDRMVRLGRRVFEDMYLSKFEEIVNAKVTSRGYRRVRYP
jgi:hypothetical protein